MSKRFATLTAIDLATLAAFKDEYPTWWWKLGWCDVSRDFDCAPQGHSPEIAFIKTPGDCWDAGFSCDCKGTFAEAIEDVMAQIDEAKHAVNLQAAEN